MMVTASKRLKSKPFNPKINTAEAYWLDDLREQLEETADGQDLKYGHASVCIDELFGDGCSVPLLVDMDWRGWRIRFTLQSISLIKRLDADGGDETAALYEIDIMPVPSLNPAGRLVQQYARVTEMLNVPVR